MTVEEIEIIVTAKVEEAIREVMKLAPEIKKVMKQAQEAFGKINTKKMQNKFQQAVQFMKKKMQDIKKSTQNNEIALKVNNKDAEKQISQLQKQIDSLQEKINARQMKLNVITPKLDEITEKTTKAVTPDGVNPDNPAIQQTINNSLSQNKEYSSLIAQEEKMTQEIAMYNQQLNEAKNKMAELTQETNQTATTQNKLSSFFDAFKGKLEQAKPSVNKFKDSFAQIPKLTQNITNNIKNMGKGLKQGLGHVLKYAGALFSLRSIYSILSNSAQSWLSSQNAGAKQLSANIDYMKYAMGSVFAPVIQWVTNLVYQLMKAIQSVVYALFRVNIFANASAKSYGAMAGSAKKAKEETKQLAGIHDEINNIQNDNNADSGSGNGGGVAPSFDLSNVDSQMLSWIDNMKEKMAKLFEPIQNSWSKYGQPLIESMKYAFNSNLEIIKTIGKSFEEVWLNGTGEHTVGTMLQILTSIFNTIGNINIAFKNAWENNRGIEIVQNLWNAFNDILDIILSVQQTYEEWTSSQSFQNFADAIIEICNTLSYWFELITQKLKEIWESGGKQTFNSLLEFISKLVQAIDEILKFLTPVVEYILGTVTPVINGIIEIIGYVIDALSGVLDFIIGVFQGDWEKAWNGIKQFFEACWNMIKAIIEMVINFIKAVIENGLKVIQTVWSNIWNGISTVFSAIWNGIVSTISNVWTTIVTKVKEGVSGAWNAITSVFRKHRKLVP